MTAERDRVLTESELIALERGASAGLLRDLTGRRVILTGRMSLQRASMIELVQAAGGTVSDTPLWPSDLLVTAGSMGGRSAKLVAAVRAGATVIDEETFVAELTPATHELRSGIRAPYGAARAVR